MLFVFWKRVGITPAFHPHVGDDVLAGDLGCFITPHFAHFLNASQMMSLLAVAHSIRRLARKLIQPKMHFGIRFAKALLGFGTMLFKCRHIKAFYFFSA